MIEAIWINPSIDISHTKAFAADNVYGLDTDYYVTFEFTDARDRVQRLFVSRSTTMDQRNHIRDFINELIKEPIDLTDVVMGDFWPNGMMGKGYDVLRFADEDLIYGGRTHGGVQVLLLVEEASEYEL